MVLTLTGFLPISAAASIYLNRHTPSGQSRLYRVAQLRTDGVHCRESAGTGPTVLKVVPVTGAAFAGRNGSNNVRLLYFPTPTVIGMKRAYAKSIGDGGGWGPIGQSEDTNGGFLRDIILLTL